MEIAIIGYGAWGQALAKIFAQASLSVTACSRQSKSWVDNNIKVTSDNSFIQSSDIILLVIPAQTTREVCHELRKININPRIPIIICSKGIECTSLYLMSEVIMGTLSHKTIAVLSGPNFAHEIMAGLPCSASLACQDQQLSKSLTALLSSKHLILHPNTDIIGTQIFGAVKNVIAIAAGIFDGRKLGQNAKSSLITAGLREIQALCIAKGGKPETAMAPCGIGDLILTCSSSKSRNISLGQALAQGISYETILSNAKSVMEGAYTAEAVYKMAQEIKINMPIATIIYQILYKNKPIETAINEMLKLI